MPDSNPGFPALLRDEDLYRAVIRVLDEGIVVQGRNGIVQACNRMAERIFGYSESELRSMTTIEARWDPVRPDGMPYPPAEYPAVAALKTGQPVRDVVVGLVRGDGRRVWIRVNSLPLFRDGAAKAYAVVSSFTDVTEERQAGIALKESEARYRQLLDDLKEAVFQTDAAGLWTFLNPAWTEITGYGVEETLGRSFLESVHPDDRERNAALFAPLIERKKESCRHEVRYRTKDGGFRWVEVYARLTLSADGSISGTTGTLSDVTDRRRAEEELARLAHVTSSIADFVVITSMEGRIEWVNQAVVERFRWTPEELHGRFAAMFLAPSNPPGVAEAVYRATKAGAWEGDLRNVTRDGHEFWVSLTTSLLEKDGRPVGMVSVSRDITDRKLNEEELRRAKDAAEAASRSKSEFLANMSHEIRTPMNAVIGMTGLLLETGLDEEQRDFVETIRSSGDSLLTILNDILDFSKMESGMLELERHPFDLRDCIEEALDLMAPKASEKGLDLAYVVEDAVPVSLYGDVTRVRQVLVNLLSNAIKFTPSGDVSVAVSARPGSGPRFEIEFAVRDTGIGISDAVKGRLFQSFSQVDASTTRQFGGTGLGLAISKRLTELMGGRIWLESEPGRGSIFRFTIAADEAPGTLRPPSMAAGTLSGMKALVVDDNATNRRILSGQLRRWGIDAADEADPAAALERLNRGERFDVALLDRQMPQMDGLELAGRIRATKGSEEIPLVLLSSVGRRKGDPDLAQFMAVLTKPVKPAQLLNVLRGLSDETPVRAKRTELEPALDPLLGRGHPLRVLLAEDNAVNQKVALRLLDRLGYRADVAANGVEALEAIRRQPYDVVFLDVQMPEMDGLEAARRLRREFGETDRPRLVAMTANAMKGDREACLAAGMDDYIAKPVKGTELMKALRTARRRVSGTSGSIVAGAAESVDGTVLATLRLVAGEGEPGFVADLIDLFLSETPEKIELLADSSASGDAPVLKRTAHSLKSSAASLGARRLSALCSWIETNPEAKTVAETLPKLRREFERVREALRRERTAPER